MVGLSTRYAASQRKLASILQGFGGFQLDFLAEIDDNLGMKEAAVLRTPPPPNHNGGMSSAMTTTDATTRPTYTQDWPAYNAAQFHEEEKFKPLLQELCASIPQPPQAGAGRPRLPLSDVIFGIGLKVYSTVSGRRAMTDLRDAQTRGLMNKSPSFASMFRYLENPEITPLLRTLIERSAQPLRTVETKMAADSSGFSSTVHTRWYDYKWGKERKAAKWVKAHIFCGVKTNIVTSADVSAEYSADSPQLPGLLDATAQTFDVQEVSADKAYSSRKNLEAITAGGATPFIPFRENTVPPLRASEGQIIPLDGTAWSKAYHFYAFNQEAFQQHYHKRSNVETTFSMIKMKFGGAVRSKTPTAQVNEVLAKILCHNICVLIQSFYELGIPLGFPNIDTKQASVSIFSRNGHF